MPCHVQQCRQPSQTTANVQEGFLSKAVLFAAAVQKLHDELRHSVDLMGIGLDNPRQDNIAEEGTAVIRETNKDMGDVR